MKLVKAEHDTEVIPNPDMSSAVASRRMKQICATPEEIAMYGYNPEGFRNGDANPGIPCDDYSE